MTARRLPERELIKPDTPLRLEVAAAVAYPDGSMSAAGLRKEASRGKLDIEKTAGKLYTTLGAIDRMRALCRLLAKDQDSGSEKNGEVKPAPLPIQLCGSSKTAATQKAHDAAATIVARLKACSLNTLPESTSAPQAHRAVTRRQSRSQTS